MHGKSITSRFDGSILWGKGRLVYMGELMYKCPVITSSDMGPQSSAEMSTRRKLVEFRIVVLDIEHLHVDTYIIGPFGHFAEP